MDSCLSGLELCVSIRRENFRREEKIKKKKNYFIVMREIFRREIRREKVAQNGPLYTIRRGKTYTIMVAYL